ncbi:MAG TPA: bifunctional nuclease family protein [Acidimicrobiales bacterium]|nr:bifunctional nuclease family protein [Acidimicrobiales bacterium]
MKHVDLIGLHLEASSGTPLILLREQDAPHRVLPIVVGGTEAAAIALALGDEPPRRPVTHDLMAALVESLGAHVDRVEVTELRDGAFHAELAMDGPTGAHRLDSRPSDAIALAVRVDAPLFVSEAVLDEAGAVLTEELDEESIEEEVARFRSFLDEVETAESFEPGERREPDGPGPDDPQADPGT